MPYRNIKFDNESFYHIFNRGINKQNIFLTSRDYNRFLDTLIYYQFTGPKPRFSTHNKFRIKDFSSNPKIVEVVCYCLMPNHFHFLIKQTQEGGTVEFMSKVANSYTKYFNIKHLKLGPLLQGEFKAVPIQTDEHLLQLSRYIHLNPYVSGLCKNPEEYHLSSYPTFISLSQSNLCVPKSILEFFPSANEYKKFVVDYQDYADRIHQEKGLLIDPED